MVGDRQEDEPIQEFPIRRVIAALAFTVAACTNDNPSSAGSFACPAAGPCQARRDFGSRVTLAPWPAARREVRVGR